MYCLLLILWYYVQKYLFDYPKELAEPTITTNRQPKYDFKAEIYRNQNCGQTLDVYLSFSSISTQI